MGKTLLKLDKKQLLKEKDRSDYTELKNFCTIKSTKNKEDREKIFSDEW